MFSGEEENEGEEPLSLETKGGERKRFVFRVKNKSSGNSWGIKLKHMDLSRCGCIAIIELML